MLGAGVFSLPRGFMAAVASPAALLVAGPLPAWGLLLLAFAMLITYAHSLRSLTARRSLLAPRGFGELIGCSAGLLTLRGHRQRIITDLSFFSAEFLYRYACAASVWRRLCTARLLSALQSLLWIVHFLILR